MGNVARQRTNRRMHAVTRPQNVQVEPSSLIENAVPVYSAPPVTKVSLWHDVDLYARSWLGDSTGIYQYVNEIPMGAMQKFEVMPDDPYNAIREDVKGSIGLKAH